MSTPIRFIAKLEKITPYVEDVFKLYFVAEHKNTRFKPGQFLHLTLEDFDPIEAYWPDSRVFSICSPPRSCVISIVYSVKGAYTTRMRNELVEGEEYWLKLPYGDFIIEHHVGLKEAAVLIAGGTGNSPFISTLPACAIHSIPGFVHMPDTQEPSVEPLLQLQGLHDS